MHFYTVNVRESTPNLLKVPMTKLQLRFYNIKHLPQTDAHRT